MKLFQHASVRQPAAQDLQELTRALDQTLKRVLKMRIVR